MGDIHSLVLLTVLLLPENKYRELGVGNELKPDGAGEAFVLLRFTDQADLQFHRPPKLPELALFPTQDHLIEGVPGNFAAKVLRAAKTRKEW